MHPSPMNVYGELSVVNETVQWSKLSMSIQFIYFIYFVYMDPKNFRTVDDIIPNIFVRNSDEIHRNIVGSSLKESDSQSC